MFGLAESLAGFYHFTLSSSSVFADPNTKSSNEGLFILTRTHSKNAAMFGLDESLAGFYRFTLSSSTVFTDPNTKRFKRTLIYFDTDTQ